MNSPAARLGLSGMVAAFVAAAVLVAYDRWIVRPALVIGTVDLAEIYRAKEAQFAQLLSGAGSEHDRQQAFAMARGFSQRLPIALEELPRDCDCLVVIRTAVVGSPHARDLTPALRRKVDLP